MAESKPSLKSLTGKFYTSARFFKQVIGTFPDGTKIWGGPYTLNQFVVMITVLVLGWPTRGLWGSGTSGLGDFMTLVVVAYGAGYLVGKLPPTRRKILGLIGSAIGLLTHPGAGGRFRGRPLRLSQKAQKIQRNRKKAMKEQERKKPDNEPDPVTDLSPSGPVTAAYGSSLNRLLAEHGLLEAEGKH